MRSLLSSGRAFRISMPCYTGALPGPLVKLHMLLEYGEVKLLLIIVPKLLPLLVVRVHIYSLVIGHVYGSLVSLDPSGQ